VLAFNGKVGVLLDEGWYCSPTCLELSARRRLAGARRGQLGSVAPFPPLKVGVMLLHQRSVSRSDLRQALDAQTRTGLRLGQQLIRMELATSEAVLRALAAQFEAGYLTTIDPLRIQAATGLLSPDAVRALGLVPIDLDKEQLRLKVACVAPLPRLALAAVRDLTGWAPEPFLVADEHWAEVLAAATSDKPGSTVQIRSVQVRDVADAAARVAKAAEMGGSARMRHASCDPYLWVRVEAEDTVEDLMVEVEKQAS
jgi:hypothetical protein